MVSLFLTALIVPHPCARAAREAKGVMAVRVVRGDRAVRAVRVARAVMAVRSAWAVRADRTQGCPGLARAVPGLVRAGQGCQGC